MLKFTQKVKDHLAKAVITPLSLSVLVALGSYGWENGNMILVGSAVLFFLEMQFVALLLLQEEDEDKNED